MNLKDVDESSPEIPLRLRELQIKIKDERYLRYAIDRIAVVVSRQIVSDHNFTDHSAEMTF